jgi:hypothetical protein
MPADRQTDSQTDRLSYGAPQKQAEVFQCVVKRLKKCQWARREHREGGILNSMLGGSKLDIPVFAK